MAGIVEPEVFWSMTPHEIYLVIRGFRRRLCMLQAIAGYGAALSAQAMSARPRRIKPPFMDDDP